MTVHYKVGGNHYDLDDTAQVDWSKAKCLGLYDLFYPPMLEGQPKEREVLAVEIERMEGEAVAICKSGCPLVRECQAEWSSLPTEWQEKGVWWGTTPKDRAVLTRAERLA